MQAAGWAGHVSRLPGILSIGELSALVLARILSLNRVLVLISSVLFYGSVSRAQSEGDPFSIRIESNLVLVHAEVVDKRLINKPPSDKSHQCFQALTTKFNKLTPSEPYLAEDCSDWRIYGLNVKDFRVFEDGVEQRIQSVREEPIHSTTIRDNLGKHEEWSHTPDGKWSSGPVLGNQPEPSSSFYRISYVPSAESLGKCHVVSVTVEKPHALVFAPKQYCYTNRPAGDPLKGNPLGMQLERQLETDAPANIPLSAQVSVIYENIETARIDIRLAFPWQRLAHHWVNGDLKANVGLLGVFETHHGEVVARFTDSAFSGGLWGAHQGFRSSQFSSDSLLELFARNFLPSRYETQLELPAGQYNLHLVLSDGEKFGRVSIPFNIDANDGKQLALSSVILFKRFRPAAAAAQEAAAVNLAPDYVPLVSQEMQITPTADTTFHDEPVRAYFEVYDPMLAQESKTTVTARMKLVNVQTGSVQEFPAFDAAQFRRPRSTIFAIVQALNVKPLPPGNYRLDVQAIDSAGRSTAWHTAEFMLK